MIRNLNAIVSTVLMYGTMNNNLNIDTVFKKSILNDEIKIKAPSSLILKNSMHTFFSVVSTWLLLCDLSTNF